MGSFNLNDQYFAGKKSLFNYLNENFMICKKMWHLCSFNLHDVMCSSFHLGWKLFFIAFQFKILFHIGQDMPCPHPCWNIAECLSFELALSSSMAKNHFPLNFPHVKLFSLYHGFFIDSLKQIPITLGFLFSKFFILNLINIFYITIHMFWSISVSIHLWFKCINSYGGTAICMRTTKTVD